MITIGLVILSVAAIFVVLIILIKFSKRKIFRRFGVGVGVTALVALAMFSGWLYFFLDGGTPWGREAAQLRMIEWINQKYGPDVYYQIIVPTRYNFKLDAYTLDVRFESNPSLGYTLEMRGHSGRVRVFGTYSYVK